MLGPSYHNFEQLAVEYDVVEGDARQALLTERLLLPKLDQILRGVSSIRDAFDNMFIKQFESVSTATPYGILSPAEYPIGFCGIIRDALFDMFLKSPVLRSASQPRSLTQKGVYHLGGTIL